MMMRQLKLSVFDIDGTIKENGGGVPAVTTRILRCLQERGHGVTVATGRPYIRVQGKLGFDPNVPMILENGGTIADNSGAAIITWPLAEEEKDLLEPLLHSPGLEFSNFCPLVDDGDHRCLYYIPGMDRKVVAKVGKVLRAATEDRATFMQWLQQRGAAKVSFSGIKEAPGLNFVYNEGYIDVSASEVSKGNAILELMKRGGLRLDQVLVAGNDFNDISMFAHDFGVRIAVGDCPQVLLKRATHWIAEPADMPRLLERIHNL